MELKTVKNEDNLMIVELVEADKTLANVLKDELYNDKKVESAAFIIEHPMTSNPQIVVRVKSGKPIDALKEAGKRVEKNAKELADKIKKAA